jgi:hypothetical protein
MDNTTDNNIHLGINTALISDAIKNYKPKLYTKMEVKLSKPLNLIPITERLPDVDQDVIGWNGTKLVAAKYVMGNEVVSENPFTTELRGCFQVEKYPCERDRTLVTYWVEITHWMPAII